jgi:GTPase SAR1 family protein
MDDPPTATEEGGTTPARLSAKVVVVGAGQVGKTTLARILCCGSSGADSQARVRHHRTVGMNLYQKEIELHADTSTERPVPRVGLQIWDMAAAAAGEFTTLRESFLSGVHAGVLVFSSSDRESFRRVPALKAEVDHHQAAQYQHPVSWVLVQHKVDLLADGGTAAGAAYHSCHLEPEPESAEPSALVSLAEGRQLAECLGGLQVFSTTSGDSLSVLAPFASLADAVHYRQLMAGPTAPGGGSGPGGSTGVVSSAAMMMKAEPSSGLPSGVRYRGETSAVSSFDSDDAFPDGIPNNPDAPSNQPFKLHKPAAQGGAGTRKFKDEFKAEIYTFICLAMSIAMFVLTFYIILPAEGVDVDPIEKLEDGVKTGR